MEEFKMFLANNYLWFLLASIILLIALIGCLIDYNKKKKYAEKTEVLETFSVEENVEQLDMPNQNDQVETLNDTNN